MINFIIRVRKEIHWELWKKFKIDHTNKWYTHYPESVLENEMHKILWDFEIQTDYLTSAWRLDLVIVNKKKKKRTYWKEDFAVPADHGEKLKESKKRDTYLDLRRELGKKPQKTMEYESDGEINSNWCVRYSH